MLWIIGLLIWIASFLVVPPDGQVIPYPVFSAALDTFGQSEVEMALCIAREESQYKADAIGSEGEIGVWQIHPIHGVPAEALRSVRVNAAAAKMIRDKGSWSHWTTAWRCM